MVGLKIYEESRLEFILDGYINNNSIIYNSKTTPFYYNIVASSGTAYLEMVNKDKLKKKIIETTIVDEFSLTVTSTKVYLTEQTADEGLYRYAIDIDGAMYFSELFCVKTLSYTEINTLKGGLLKFYDNDFFEYSLAGYIENNTLLELEGNTIPFYFTPNQIPSSKIGELYKIDKEKLKQKIFSETKVKDVTLQQKENIIYYNKQKQNEGIYRFKITVENGGLNYHYYSDIFKVCKNNCGEWTFIDNECVSSLDNTNLDFIKWIY